MDNKSAPPPGLEDFLTADGSTDPLSQAPVAAPNILQQSPYAAPVPEGLKEFLNPPSLLTRAVHAINEHDNSVQEDHRNQPGAITAGLEGAASALTFGASTGLEVASGLRTPEEIRHTRENHPYANLAGQGVGLVGGVLGGDALGGALGLAGKAIEGVGGAAGSLTTNRVASAALRAAAENAMVQGGDEVSKAFSQDPNQHLQTAAVNIGLSGIIGGLLGGGTEAALGAVSPLWKARHGEATNGLLNDVVNEAENTGEAARASDLAIPENPSEGRWSNFINSGPERPNADLVRQAAEDNGLKLGPEALLVDSQPTRDALSQRASPFGVKYRKELDHIHEVAHDLINDVAFKDASDLTKHEAGGKIIDEILRPLKEEGDALQSRFEKMDPVLRNIEVSPEAKQAAVQSILDNEMTKVAPELQSLANRTAKQVEGVDNLVTLKRVRTYINNELEKALPSFGARDVNRGNILLSAKDALSKIEESSIVDAAHASGIGKKGAGEVSSEMINELQQLRGEWSAHKTNLREAGLNLGMGDFSSAGQAQAKLFKPGLKDESFVKRVLDPDNVGTMGFMQKNYPDAFETARRYRLSEMRGNSISMQKGGDQSLSVGSALQQFNKLSPEGQAAILKTPEAIKAVRDAGLLYTGALPKNYNPSGTAAAISWGDLASKKGLINAASDAWKYAMLKGVPYLKQTLGGGVSSRAVQIGLNQVVKSGAAPEAGAFKALVQYIEHAIQGDAQLSKLAASIFEAGSLKLPNAIVSDKNREKLNEKLLGFQENPEELANLGGDTAHYSPEHTTAIAQTAAGAVMYLNSLRPDTSKKMPFDSVRVADPIKKADFHRALDIAQSPLLALSGIKDGMVSTKDMTALNKLYPALYPKITSKINEHMTNAIDRGVEVPYKTRIGVAMFTGQPLDSSMTPQSIMAAQPKPQQPQQQGPQAPKSPGPHNYDALSKIANSYQTPGQAREAGRGRRS